MTDTKKNLNKEIIALFSGQSSVVTTPRLYIQLTGSHSLGSVLNQSVFWSNKSECQDGWFHKTYEDWTEEIQIPERTLRRLFDKLEKKGWLTTKVKKVRGINTKHVRPNMDNIIDSISRMLSIECPIRPLVNSGTEIEHKTCTKVAPYGHIGRSEPATLADSTIYTEEYLQKSVGASAPQHTKNENSSTAKTRTEDGVLKDEELREFFSAKFRGLDVTYENIFNDCQEHYESKGQYVTIKKMQSWLEREKLDNYAKAFSKPKIDCSQETEQEQIQRQWFTNELQRERDEANYISSTLKQYPEARERYQKYI
jgi:hypothetical protein